MSMLHRGVISVATDFSLVDYMVSHEADQSELDIFADFHQRSPVENMSMDSTQMLIDPTSPQNKQQMSGYGHNQSQQIHSQHQQQQQQHQHQHQHHQHQHQHQHQHPQQPSQLPQHRQQTQLMTAEMLDLKDRLEQQMKLQQLQQLLLQQQIDLLSGATQSSGQHLGSSHHQKDGDMFGLLTPGPSTDLPAMVPKELVPPMMLQSDMFLGSPATSLSSHHPDGGPIINPNPSFSAPAALAFPTTSPFSLPTDFSPISSPWIHPHNSQPQHDTNSQQALLPLPLQPPNQHHQSSSGHAFHPNISRPHLKRVGSVDDHMVDHHPPRKRSLRTTPPSSSSVTSTPMSAPIPNSSTYYYPTNDTPSPVDLSMTGPPLSSTSSNSPPPASNIDTHTGDATSSTPIAPMTPASILNLRSRFSTGLMTSTQLPTSNNLNFTAPDQKEIPNKKSSGGKAKAGLPSSTVTGRGRKGSVATLKPLLPGTQPPTPTSPLSLPTNPAGSSATGAPRKSSHKVAEQKRRDSLKTSFDELRLLLPPVALPEDEELLPGCMPPRGPPKGDADGPNRGVSKLALLRCGNAYIKELKGMVQRRDSEITLLRDEIRRLRSVVGDQDIIDRDGVGGYPDGKGGSTSRIDIEKDVDEGRQIEAGIRFGMNANGLSSVQEEGDDDD